MTTTSTTTMKTAKMREGMRNGCGGRWREREETDGIAGERDIWTGGVVEGVDRREGMDEEGRG